MMENKIKNTIDDKKEMFNEKVVKIGLVDRFPEGVVKKKAQSVRLVHFNEVKINKRIQKALTILTPPSLPKYSVPNIIPTTTSQPKSFNYNTASNYQLKGMKKPKEPSLEDNHKQQ